MQLNKPNAHIFIPDGSDSSAAIRRCTHLCIAAHQDDVEIMAYGPIGECYDDDMKWFGAVVVTDGAGSPRDGEYATMTDQEMQLVRAREQDDAAAIGRYTAMWQLAYPSREVKKDPDGVCAAELAAIIKAAAPTFLYTHNPADKHDTHVAVLLRTLEALRLLSPAERPQKFFALEVWRGLDWLVDDSKVVFDTAPWPDVAERLLSIFHSQCAGGKRYDLAALGRRLANATFFASHAVDDSASCTYGLDISELMNGGDVSAFISHHIDDLRGDVFDRIERVRN